MTTGVNLDLTLDGTVSCFFVAVIVVLVSTYRGNPFKWHKRNVWLSIVVAKPGYDNEPYGGDE